MLPPGTRGSKIKPPRKSVSATGFDYEKSWQVLSNAIVQIQQKNVSNLSYEQLYRKAYTLVLHKCGNRLYENVAQLIREHLLRRRDAILAARDDELVKLVLLEWSEHLQAMKFVSDVLMYLNRVYIREQNKLLIYDLGIQLFKDSVIKHNDNEVGTLLIDTLMREVQRNRRGEVSSKIYITEVISMFELLHEDNVENYYQKYFEPVFLSQSELFFNQLTHDLLNYGSSMKFVLECHQFIVQELNRINFYLPESTTPKLIDLMDNILIKGQLDTIINFPVDGLHYWIEPLKQVAVSDVTTSDDPSTYLKVLYQLNARIDSSCQLLKVRLHDIIVREGKQFPSVVKVLLASQESKEVRTNSALFAIKWIDSVLKYKSLFSTIVKDCFDHDASMDKAITGAVQDFVNLSKKKADVLVVNPSELLSVYIDHYIKLFLKPGSSTENVDEVIEKCTSFLRFINDKDAFEAHYKNHFAKRFLTSKGFNVSGVDIEELILSKLTEELGNASLEDIIKMNSDIKSSRDTTLSWRRYVSEKDEKPIDMDLKICNVTYWPNSMTKDYKNLSGKEGDVKFIWPKEIRHTVRQFEQFWSNGKNESKSLYWSPKFGSIDLKITYPSRTYEINLATYAGVIMLLFAPQSAGSSAFEEKKQLTYEEIRELTGIPESDLRRHLQSIAVAPKSRLLVKKPMSKEINNGDLFQLNVKFKSPSVKVKVLTVSGVKKTEKEKELEDIESSINEGRKHEINAAIVRVLKSRQSINHNELVTEILKQLSSRFVPQTVMIKRQVEDLIDKDYIKRDDETKNLYHYIA